MKATFESYCSATVGESAASSAESSGHGCEEVHLLPSGERGRALPQRVNTPVQLSRRDPCDLRCLDPIFLEIRPQAGERPRGAHGEARGAADVGQRAAVAASQSEIDSSAVSEIAWSIDAYSARSPVSHL